MFLYNEEFLKEVPEEVSLPRILFDIQAKILSPVQEMTEDSETYEENSEELSAENWQILKSKNTTLSLKNIELEQQLLAQKRNFEDEIDQIKIQTKSVLSGLNHTIKLMQENMDKLTEKYEKVVKEAENLENEKNFQTKEKFEIQDKLNKTFKLHEEAKLRENSILTMLEQKDFEIFLLNNKLNKASQVSFSNTQTLSIISDKNFVETGEKLKEYENIIETLKKELYEKDVKLSTYSLKIHEDIDFRLKKFLFTKKLDNFASISNELIYYFGKKKVSVSVKNDAIYCAGGGLIKKIESFVQQNCSKDLENYKKNNTLSHKRFNTVAEIEKIGGSVIHKTFDSTKRTKSSKRISKVEFVTPTRRVAFSPLGKKLQNRL